MGAAARSSATVFKECRPVLMATEEDGDGPFFVELTAARTLRA